MTKTAKELIEGICEGTGGVARMGTSDWEFEKELCAKRIAKRVRDKKELESFGLAGLPGGARWAEMGAYQEDVNEQLSQAVKLIWKKLPKHLKIDIKQLEKFLSAIEDGIRLKNAASSSNIPLNVAAEILDSVQRSGLL